MKHFVFAGFHYYPNGGMSDLHFEGTYEQCIEYLIEHSYDWYQIVKIRKGQLIVVKESK